MDINWEKIDNHTERLKVPKGWIIRSFHDYSIHQIFIEDINYIWDRKKDEKKKKNYSHLDNQKSNLNPMSDFSGLDLI